MSKVDTTASYIKDWLANNSTYGITHMVGTGISGQSMIWPVSYKLGLPVCIVRKPYEKSHGSMIQGDGELGNYIIVDDQIDSGATIKRIVHEIEMRYQWLKAEYSEGDDKYPRMQPMLYAIFLYRQDGKQEWFHLTEPGQERPVPIIVTGTTWS